MISFILNVYNQQTIEKEISDHLGLEGGMELTADGYKKTFGNIENVLKWVIVMVVQKYTFIKTLKLYTLKWVNFDI